MQRQQEGGLLAAICVFVLAWGNASAEIELRNASVDRLDNGMTVILLSDRNFPVVSTQMLYRVGARDESYGHTGLAHFLEHMAFRSSESFPDTGLVSSIYAVGGEWHGYTWTDQTTYFATVPKEQLDLLLRIEADRMTRLRISPHDMEAERGAVLAEMHMYENYPTSMLLDAVIFTSFFAHPYRNNTIGWESDIENLKHEEVVAFYDRHYQPANAVLAVVGDIDRRRVRARIKELFGDVEGRAPTPLPHTIEPVQEGERRVQLHAETDVKRFMIGWRAPAVNHADFAAFLVLQEVLGAGSGINFRQNDWGTPIDGGAVLDGLADDLTTWYPPSAQDYVFIVGGSIAVEAEEAELELALQERIATLQRQAPGTQAVAEAIERVQDELVYDVETTEDAAHQLAFFDGLGALASFLELPQRVARVTAEEVQRAAAAWLLPERRTIGWHVPDPAPDAVPAKPPIPAATQPGSVGETDASASAAPPDDEPVSPPEARQLGGGIPAIVQHSDVSASAYLQVVLPGADIVGEGVQRDEPILGHSSFAWRFRPDELPAIVERASKTVRQARVDGRGGEAAATDPETVIEQVFAAQIYGGAAPDRETGVSPAAVSPSLIVVAGDVDPQSTFEALEAAFGDLEVQARQQAPHALNESSEVKVHLERPVAQAQLGYMVPAPPPADEMSYPHRILLYILSHGYEGRLGKEAISNQGLAYYIDARYRSDGANGWITLAVGVDPDKLPALRLLMAKEFERLQDEPPTKDEIAEAKRHLLGRARSAAQSNRELSAALAESWLWYGDNLTPRALERKLGGISRQDVLDALPAFTDGATVIVDR